MTNVDPNYWFLEAGMVPRTPHYTSGNEVEALIDGEAYMNHLADRIAAMRGGDYFHLAGWRVNGAQRLRAAAPGSPTFIQDIYRLIRIGVRMRVMLWYVPGSFLGVATGHGGENIRFVRDVLRAPVGQAGVRGAAILDERLARKVSAHHQKTAVLRSAGQDWAYVGGIDICPDRWDRPSHDNSPARTREAFEGWHDVHSVVRGPAAAQVWDNFRERWNDPTRPHTYSRAPGGEVPAPIAEARPAPAPVSRKHVQVLRTLACGGVYTFARAGEQTVRLAYERAIERAQHYIYIEDQYVWPCTLDDRLRDAAARGVKVIFVMAHKFDIAAVAPYHNELRGRVLERIRSGNPAHVYTFHLQRKDSATDIYLHSKLMIIDDCYAAIGSANYGRRSHTTDGELHLAVVDGETVTSAINGQPATVCRFAKELRISLWMEHLGLTDRSGIEDPIAGLAQWPASSAPVTAPARRHHAVWYTVPAKRFRRPATIPANFMNIETMCPQGRDATSTELPAEIGRELRGRFGP